MTEITNAYEWSTDPLLVYTLGGDPPWPKGRPIRVYLKGIAEPFLGIAVDQQEVHGLLVMDEYIPVGAGFEMTDQMVAARWDDVVAIRFEAED